MYKFSPVSIAWYSDNWIFYKNDSEVLEVHNCLLNYHRKKKELEEEFNVKCIKNHILILLNWLSKYDNIVELR